MMIILTVIRRLSIFVIAVALLINSVLLVLAKTYKVRAYVPKRETAYGLARELKLEQGRYRVLEVSRDKRVNTGGYRVEWQFARANSEQVEKMKHTLESLGVLVVLETSEDSGRTVRVNQEFATKQEADQKVKEILGKSNGLFRMSAVPATKKMAVRTWCLEMSMADEDSVRVLRDRLKGKASLDPR